VGKDNRPNRRRVLELLVGAGGVALACAAAAPPIAYILAPAAKRGGGGERWVRTVRLDALEEGVARRVALVADRRAAWVTEKNVELGSVWLLRRGETVQALSAECPHLGCTIARAPDNAGFACPCHDSYFAVDGRRQDGPSPRDMDALAWRVTDGWVEVDFRSFRTGVPDQVEIG